MGIIGAGLAGGLEKGGEGVARVGGKLLDAEIEKEKQAAIAARELNLQRLGFAHREKMVGVESRSRLAERQAGIEQDVDPENVRRRGLAAGTLIEATIPARVKERKELAAVDIQTELDKFSKLAPLHRQEAIDSAVAVLTAKSTPEMLEATKKIAQAGNIVNPSYALIPNADGTVTTFDSRSGKSGGTLMGPDGKPIIRKDPAELTAATAVINMANTNLKIAQAEHKAAIADIGIDPATRAAANTVWK